MHALQPKHIKLKTQEIEEICKKFNISPSQLPKIKSTDSSLPDGCERGDVIRIERDFDGKQKSYYRVVA